MQGTSLHVEVPAVQTELVVLNALCNPGKAFEIPERDQDRRLFAGTILRGGSGIAEFLQHTILGWISDADPAAEEVRAFTARELLVHKGSYAAAAAVAEHDDAFHLELGDGKLQCGGNPLPAVAAATGGDEIGDIAYGEDVAGIAVQQQGRIDA